MARICISFVLCALLTFSLQGCAGVPPIPASHGEWILHCESGRDEFASNCVAVNSTADWRVEISTGDSQVLISIAAGGCPGIVEESNWDRLEMASLSLAKRRSTFDQALRQMELLVRQSCPKAPLRATSLKGAPDITVRGAP